ncbi:MAG TPA: apolipoprotein N-acyltransferase, partial [Oligoflexia bacterium]|nr:apolipoprotein N-acyltransferase [Oligoflexia bacterium]
MRVAAITAGALILLFLGFGIWGNHRITQLQALERSFSREFRFSVIQANIGDAEKLESESGFARAIYRVLDTYREMTIDAVKKRPDTDLLIWAETAFPLLYLHFDNPIADQSSIGGRSYIKNVAREAGKPLYFGGYAARGKRDYNSAFLLNSDGKILDYYHKSILLAFGEYVPLGPFSSYIQDLVPAIADFGRGAGPMIMSLPLSERDHVRLAPQICYEGLVPEFSRRSVRDGADVLINITNDSWFGDTSEPHQHLGLTRFRSIELRRPMIRATNTGISAVLGLSGDLNFQTPLFQPTVMQGTIRLPGPEQKFPSTFYARLGEVFAHFASVVALVFLLRNIKTIGRRLRLGRR